MNPIHEAWKAALRALRPSPPPAPKPLARTPAAPAPAKSESLGTTLERGAEMKKYVVFVQALHQRLNRNVSRREEVCAKTAVEACRIAVARNPTLGVTPTTVSMFWPV